MSASLTGQMLTLPCPLRDPEEPGPVLYVSRPSSSDPGPGPGSPGKRWWLTSAQPCLWDLGKWLGSGARLLDQKSGKEASLCSPIPCPSTSWSLSA